MMFGIEPAMADKGEFKNRAPNMQPVTVSNETFVNLGNPKSNTPMRTYRSSCVHLVAADWSVEAYKICCRYNVAVCRSERRKAWRRLRLSFNSFIASVSP